MRRPSRIVVLDCGASHVSVAVFAWSGESRPVLERFVTERHGADPDEPGDWAAVTGRSLAALGRREKLGGECVMAVPPHLALVRFAQSPAVDRSRREQVIRFEASQHIPYAPEEVVWDWQEVADDGNDFEFMLAAVKAEEMTALCRAVEAAGFRPGRAWPAGLALHAAWRRSAPATADGVMVADIGARSTQLLFVDGEKFHLRTLALGGDSVPRAIADEQKLTFAEAEAVKLRIMQDAAAPAADSPLHDAVQRAGTNFKHRLALELNRAVAAYAQQTGAQRPAQVFLTGGGSQIPGLADVLADKLGVPAGAFPVLQGLQPTDAAKTAVQLHGVHLAVPAGLAGMPEDGALNLLPPAWNAAVTFRRAQGWWLAGAAALVLAVVPPYWQARARERSANLELQRLEAALVPLRAQRAANEATAGEIGRLGEELTRLQRLVDARSGWAEFMADLQNALQQVEDAWLDRLQALPPAPGETDPTAPRRLALSGLLLDVRHPLVKAGPETNARARQLLELFRNSRFVAAVEEERFDASQPGLLRFEFVLRLESATPL
ncbi:MAG: pilus assembly protein PilM [Opitutaceae bacterium]|nr:pilus assembly protein PilM [Opitutaceae bacterium]